MIVLPGLVSTSLLVNRALCSFRTGESSLILSSGWRLEASWLLLCFTKWFDLFFFAAASIVSSHEVPRIRWHMFVISNFKPKIQVIQYLVSSTLPRLNKKSLIPACPCLQVKSFRSCLLLEAQAQAAAPENKPILLRDLGRNYPPEDQSGLDCLQHFLCSLFYMLEWTLFFLICLVVIGFNIWNLLAAITGLSLGYLLFGKGRLN